MPLKKRFIAGAICPHCSALDTITMWSVDDMAHRECVACQYQDKLNAQGQAIPVEPVTRVSFTAKIEPDPKVRVAHFYPNPKHRQ